MATVRATSAARYLAGAMLVLAGAGCAEPAAVQQTGPNSFFLSEIFLRGEFDAARARAVTRAGEYCVNMNRKILVEYVVQGPTNGHGAGTALVNFQCLYRSDPALQRAK